MLGKVILIVDWNPGMMFSLSLQKEEKTAIGTT